jgi:hypothetical protein
MSASVAAINGIASSPLRVVSQADRLASHGEIVASWLSTPTLIPWRWRAARFARTVDLVRAHLRPLTNRDLLVRSYAREHFQYNESHRTTRGDSVALIARDATEVAYALRWLELGEEEDFRSWPALLDPRRPE